MQSHLPHPSSTAGDLQSFVAPELSLLLLLFLTPIATLTPITTAINIANVPKMKIFVFRRCGIAIPAPASPRITIRTRSMYGGNGSSMSWGLYSGGGVLVRDCGTGTRSSERLSSLLLLLEEGRRWGVVAMVVVVAGTWVPASRSLRG